MSFLMKRFTCTKEDLNPTKLLVGFNYGMINTILSVPGAYGYTEVIFSDPFFKPYIPSLARILLFSCCVHQLMITLLSTLPFAIGQVQDAGLIFLSNMASATVAAIAADNPNADPKEKISTVVVFLAFSTLLLGISLVIMGKTGMAVLVAYLPMPVISGYLAYIGLFCLQAGLELCSEKELHTILDWDTLFNYHDLIRCAPGVVVGFLYWVISCKCEHWIWLPGSMILTPIVFYLVLLGTGYTLQEARDNQWVTQDVPPATVLDIIHLFDFEKVNWSKFPLLIPNWFAMTFVVSFSSCLDVAAIEMDMGRQLDVNHELKTVGWCNIWSGLTGGYTGSYIFSQTIFTYRKVPGSRFVGWVHFWSELALFCWSGSPMSYLPNFFLAASLIFIAFDLLYEWLVLVFKLVTLREYGIIWITFILINILGIEWGMLASMVVAAVNFMIGYAMEPSVRLGKKISHTAHSSDKAETIEDRRNEWLVINLEGYLFFGTSVRVLNFFLKEVKIRNEDEIDAQNSAVDSKTGVGQTDAARVSLNASVSNILASSVSGNKSVKSLYQTLSYKEDKAGTTELGSTPLDDEAVGFGPVSLAGRLHSVRNPGSPLRRRNSRLGVARRPTGNSLNTPLIDTSQNCLQSDHLYDQNEIYHASSRSTMASNRDLPLNAVISNLGEVSAGSLTRCVVLDFTKVIGVDTSASRSCFQIIAQNCRRHGILLIFANVPASVESMFRANGIIDGTNAVMKDGVITPEELSVLPAPHVALVDRVEYAVALAEEYLLKLYHREDRTSLTWLERMLHYEFHRTLARQRAQKAAEDGTEEYGYDQFKDDLQSIMELFTEEQHPTNAVIWRPGDESRKLYIIENGEVGIYSCFAEREEEEEEEEEEAVSRSTMSKLSKSFLLKERPEKRRLRTTRNDCVHCMQMDYAARHRQLNGTGASERYLLDDPEGGVYNTPAAEGGENRTHNPSLTAADQTLFDPTAPRAVVREGRMLNWRNFYFLMHYHEYAVTTRPTKMYSISYSRWIKMRKHFPDLCIVFESMFVRSLCGSTITDF